MAAIQFGWCGLKYDDALLEFQRAYFTKILEEARGCVTTAAAAAGRNRSEIYRVFHRLGLKPADFRNRYTV